MARYSIEPKDLIFVEVYGFLSIHKNMSCENSQKLLDKAKQSATDTLKTAEAK